MRTLALVGSLTALSVGAQTGAGGPKPLSPTPGFDCGRATGKAETLICQDAELSRMDREVGRLFSLASRSAAGRRDPNLKPMQRGWIKGRDDCWKDDDLRRCVRDSYVFRIMELRRDYPAARAEPAGWPVSIGPRALRCPGLEGFVSATFVNTDPGAVALTLGDQTLVLPHVISASGARYAGSEPDGEYVLWNKGREYRLERPGKEALNCTEAP